MFDVKELENTKFKMLQPPNFPKKIKVTTEFWNELKSRSWPELPEEYIARCHGLPVEVDDDIEGHYKIIY